MRDINPMDAVLAIGMFSLVGLVLYLGFQTARNAQQTSVRKALLERFASAQDLGAFLQTGGGQRFISDLTSGLGSPLHSVLGSIHKGVISIFLGAGFFPLSGAFGQFSSAVTGIGILLFCVGSGFLVSAILTYGLSRWFGLLPDWPRADQAKPAEK